MNAPLSVGLRGATLVVWLFTASCTHHRFGISHPVRIALVAHAAQLPVVQCHARVHMDVLEVELQVRRGDEEFHSDLRLEEEQAALIAQAVARSEVVFDQRWYAMHLVIHTRFGGFRWRNRYSFVKFIFSREDMERLRAGTLVPAAVKNVWHRQTAVKQDGGGETLEWPADVIEPIRRSPRK